MKPSARLLSCPANDAGYDRTVNKWQVASREVVKAH